MELINKNYLISKNLVVSEVSEKKELATDIHKCLGLPFWRIYKLINRNGIQCVRECYTESKKEGKNPTALFLFLNRKNETKLL